MQRMTTMELWGWIGGITGGLLGLLGGVIGSWFSIKNTNGPRERAFMIRATAVCWVAILLFLGLMFALPMPYRFFLWIPYGVLLPLGISYWNRRQRQIRREELRRGGE
jgi:hypothetical protein